jgi:hypothetical protein
MVVETKSGKFYKVLEQNADGSLMVEQNGQPVLLTEPIKRLLFDALFELLKNLFKKWFKLS